MSQHTPPATKLVQLTIEVSHYVKLDVLYEALCHVLFEGDISLMDELVPDMVDVKLAEEGRDNLKASLEQARQEGYDQAMRDLTTN